MAAESVLALDRYRLLGRSGLRVSPLALGAMTFGEDWGWGASREESRRIFDTYVDAGGNFLDTSANYTNGSSEELLGAFASGRRDSLVLATKYTCSTSPDDPNASGNHRKNMLRTVEASLRRLRTDHIDLLYLHAWDDTTPVEEILRAMDDLVRAGKVLYLGISNTPAWQVSRMQAIADLRGWNPLVALQVEYNLAQRTVERELIPMAAELGLGVVPWSPLAGGVLTGKYGRDDLPSDTVVTSPSGTRKDVATGSGELTEHSLAMADLVREVADELGHTPSQVALAWTLTEPAVTAPIMGARTLAQLQDNLGALSVRFTDEQLKRLAHASEIGMGFPHEFLSQPMIRTVIHGNVRLDGRSGPITTR